MQFVKPMPFAEALDKLGAQSPVTAALSASEWSDLPVELRENAFFSANVESLRFLQSAQDSITDYLAANVKTLDDGQTLLATGSRAAFVDQMQRRLGIIGVERTDGGLTDITSERRLGLIFDIKTQQAGDYGYWRQGMNPAVLNEFPASRFIRVKDVQEPRELHVMFQDQVYLKTDPIWVLEINRDFGVPWGPWGWGCGHDVEDVDRDETDKLGLTHPGQKIAAPKKFFNTNLQASAHGIEPELLKKLEAVFGERIKIEGDVIRWRGQAGAAQPGDKLTDAEKLALNGYTRTDYRAMNYALRAGDDSNSLRAKADTLTQALAKLNNYEGTVYRGSPGGNKETDALIPGNVITWRGFTSTSRTIPFPGNINYTIESRTGKRIARYSSHRAETEVLFDQGTQFKVLSRAFEDGVWQVKLEELAP